MKKFVKLALVAAGISLAAAASASDNWTNSAGEVWKSGAGEVCLRNGSWTPATAAAGCGNLIAGGAAAGAAGASGKTGASAGTVASQKVSYKADAFFDFDKSVLKAEGKAALNDIVAKLQGVSLEVVIAVGHTDSIGTDAYNLALSKRRAAAVKAYLVSKGVDAARVYTEGKGEKQPIADNHTAEGRAKNRRVEIEVVGTSK